MPNTPYNLIFKNFHRPSHPLKQTKTLKKAMSIFALEF
jgi:hypothetical protein